MRANNRRFPKKEVTKKDPVKASLNRTPRWIRGGQVELNFILTLFRKIKLLYSHLFIFDEYVTKLNFNDFLNIFIVRTHYLSIYYLFLYCCIVKT